MDVLSLSQQISELDRLATLRSGVLTYFSESVRAAAERLICFDEKAVAEHRERLLVTATQIENAKCEVDVQRARQGLVRILDEHRDQGESYIAGIRENLQGTARMLHSLISQMSRSGAPLHDALQNDVSNLGNLIQIEEIQQLRAELQRTSERMTKHLSEMRREYQMLLTQMQNEIQTLHRELAACREGRGRSNHLPANESHDSSASGLASITVPSTGMKRPDFEELLRIKAEQGGFFSLAVLWMSNLTQLFGEHEPDTVIEAMEETANGIAQALAESPFWLRWEDDCFVVCVDKCGSEASSWSHDVARRLSGMRRVRSGAQLELRISSGVVEQTKGEPADKVVLRTAQFIRSFRMI